MSWCRNQSWTCFLLLGSRSLYETSSLYICLLQSNLPPWAPEVYLTSDTSYICFAFCWSLKAFPKCWIFLFVPLASLFICTDTCIIGWRSLVLRHATIKTFSCYYDWIIGAFAKTSFYISVIKIKKYIHSMILLTLVRNMVQARKVPGEFCVRNLLQNIFLPIFLLPFYLVGVENT